MVQIACIENYASSNSLANKAWRNKPTINSFPQDTVLDQQAFQNLPILMISKGVIGLQHTLGDGRQTISIVYFAGEVIDFRHLGSVSGRAICLLPVIVKLFNGEDYDRMQRQDQEFQQEQSAISARQLFYASQHSIDLARKSAVEKLASFILENRKRANLGRALTVHLKLRRTDIADYMGLRAETLSRAFSKLKNMRLITYSDADEIHITNEPMLRQLANGKPLHLKVNMQ
ncbi:hypothetical protein MNBD_ALPHA08-2226 [hydrothermal vent metagenome]|uniref:HTH crp-type domain-containing protein n=1 Tax=hydrothermal vent metagenome TaxID=652676 RepID=A0A3B0RWE7_9ZZZZ